MTRKTTVLFIIFVFFLAAAVAAQTIPRGGWSNYDSARGGYYGRGGGYDQAAPIVNSAAELALGIVSEIQETERQKNAARHDEAMVTRGLTSVENVAKVVVVSQETTAGRAEHTAMPNVSATRPTATSEHPAQWGSPTGTPSSVQYYFIAVNRSAVTVEFSVESEKLAVLDPGQEVPFKASDPTIIFSARRVYLQEKEHVVAGEWLPMKVRRGAIVDVKMADSTMLPAKQLIIEEPQK